MSTKKNESGSAHWGKTSRFTFKNAAKRQTAFTTEERDNFIKYGILPKFKSVQRSEKYLQKKYAAVETDLLPEAITILNKVRDQFGNDGSFIEAAYGEKITVNRASEVIHNYLVEHGIDGMMSVIFSSDLDCSGKMQWTGPLTKYNQPEKRNYSMWVKATYDNIYFRETGILNLTNHEIGTHFFRSINDGLQIWFSNRVKFGLTSYKSQAMKDTEEGFASLNTAFESKVKYIWGPAMLYYTACMSMEMNFKDLFDHLSYYVADPEIRWKWIVRVKRGRAPSQLGGSGKDQCYFRGAVNILRNVDSIDFNLLFAGKITVEDLPRVQRLARLGCIKTPYFLKDMNNYRRYMKNLLKVNGIPNVKPIPKEPEIRVVVQKTPRSKEDKSKNSNRNNNRPTKKSPRTLMLESRQRIMSTKLLCKSRSRATEEDGDRMTYSLSAKTLTIEHENETDGEVNFDDGDKDASEEPETERTSLPAVEETPSIDQPSSNTSSEKVVPVKSKQSISPSSSRMNSQSGVDSDNEDNDTTGCADAFCIPNHKKTRKLSAQQLKEQEQKEIQEYFGNSAAIEKRPSISSVTTSRGSTPQNCLNGALQLVREIPSTPKTKIHPVSITPTLKPEFFDISSTYVSAIREPKIRTSRTPTPFASIPRSPVRTPTPSAGRRSVSNNVTTPMPSITTTTTSKKSVKKNLTVFFEDLIPFSKSRRKRVLPLPVKS